jgi:hypothetical protein
VDLFAIDEVVWVGVRGYADKVCVLNDSVRRFLMDAGRTGDEVVVTGNPAFDALLRPEHRAAGAALRRDHGWEGRQVLLWASQREPAVHPFDGRPGDPTLPARALQSLLAEVLARDDVVLCVRPRPGELAPELPAHPRIHLCGQDWPLTPLLWASDVVLTLNSTVALEGHLTGARVVQILGSVFDQAMPLGPYGISDASVPLAELPRALAQVLRLPRRQPERLDGATPQVLAVIEGLLHPAR